MFQSSFPVCIQERNRADSSVRGKKSELLTCSHAPNDNVNNVCYVHYVKLAC